MYVYSSRQQQSGPTHSAGIRKQVYTAIAGRQADLAMQLVEHHFPEVLNNSESSAPLFLCCQNFIDKARPFTATSVLHTILYVPDRAIHLYFWLSQTREYPEFLLKNSDDGMCMLNAFEWL